MDREVLEAVRDLHRHLNSVEHMIYVSCKYTRTTEMLKKVMEAVVQGYEQFFGIAYQMFIEEGFEAQTVFDKIQILKDGFLSRGLSIDLSDYFLIKRLLMSEFECIGEYRKNLCMVSYLDGEEYIINITQLLEYYNHLKTISEGLNKIQLVS